MYSLKFYDFKRLYELKHSLCASIDVLASLDDSVAIQDQVSCCLSLLGDIVHLIATHRR